MRQVTSIVSFLLILSLLHCSVDYSLLENRYCNSDNECAKGYKCETNTRKCIRSENLTDANIDVNVFDVSRDTSEDILIKDRRLPDDYDEAQDILYYDTEETSDENTNIDDITDSGSIDVLPDSSSCQPASLSCRDNDLYLCDENGEWAFNKVCEKGCIVDHCSECLIGERRCKDETTIEICGEDGLFKSQQCPHKCYNNECVVCLPSEKYCNDKTAVRCNAIGSRWEETQCEIGCSNGDCMICNPQSQFTCNGNDLQICSEDGLSYVFYRNCCHENNCDTDRCVKTAPRVLDYNPKDWKVGSNIEFVIDGCFFVKDKSRVLINYGGSWKEITSYSNISYASREEEQIRVNIKVLTGSEYDFKVVNPDGQESESYPIKKHW